MTDKLRAQCEPMLPDEEGWSEWIHPLPGFIIECCDCGLQHEMQVAITAPHEAVSVANEGEDGGHCVVFRMRRPDIRSAEAGDAELGRKLRLGGLPFQQHPRAQEHP